MSSIQHGEEITTNKYYDGEIIGTVHELEQQKFTDKQFLLKDLIDGIAVLTSGETNKLTIEICIDKRDRYKLTQRWRIS